MGAAFSSFLSGGVQGAGATAKNKIKQNENDDLMRALLEAMRAQTQQTYGQPGPFNQNQHPWFSWLGE